MVTSTHAPAAPTAATAVAQASSAKGARIDVRNVSHWFDLPGGALQVIDELDLAIEPGEFVALLGPSGCGKSTLLRLVAGLEPATAGELLQDGAPITQPDPSRIVVFQDPTLFPWRTVWDNVALGLQARGLLKTHRHRVDQALQLVGLEAFGKAFPHQLSGGMARRVLTAIATVSQADLLIADEPTSGLDPEVCHMALTHLRSLADSGKAVLVITHDLNAVRHFTDRIVVMQGGRTVDAVDATTFASGQATHPFTRALYHALPQNGFNLPEEIAHA